MTMEAILLLVNRLMAKWQEALGSTVEVVLGGSLVSGLLLLDEETKVIDVDVRFLTDDPTNEQLRQKVEEVTSLQYRKTIQVGDWPSGESIGIMVEGFLQLPECKFPFEVEGCIRSKKYVGWHRFYHMVLTEQELEECRQTKRELRHDKKAYKAFKAEVRCEVECRCVERGLV